MTFKDYAEIDRKIQMGALETPVLRKGGLEREFRGEPFQRGAIVLKREPRLQFPLLQSKEPLVEGKVYSIYYPNFKRYRALFDGTERDYSLPFSFGAVFLSWSRRERGAILRQFLHGSFIQGIYQDRIVMDRRYMNHSHPDKGTLITRNESKYQRLHDLMLTHPELAR
jgi:hypothetical protein